MSIFGNYDQFYEEILTYKTPSAAAIVEFQFFCATAISGPAFAQRTVRLNCA